MTVLQQRPWVAQAHIHSPLGTLLLAATAQGLGGAWFNGQAHHPGPLNAPEDPGHALLKLAAGELHAYWQDARHMHFTVPLDPGGTPFQQAVWRALLAIPPGVPSSYGRIAAQLYKPKAVRAVGAAVGRNPLSIIVPCHRVLGHDGSLTGYAGGLDRKRELLRRESPPAWPTTLH
jgi:methylated-DNA-[protein]-cysteine S-methyltransferase